MSFNPSDKDLPGHEFNKFDVDENNLSMVRFFQGGGQGISPLAKFVEAAYTNSDMTVTYKYYESASKATLYNTIVLIYTSSQDTTFTSAEWS